jgi:hypothetical protein
VVLLLAGCGGKKGPLLTGKVLYKGQPVTGGTLSLVALGGTAPKDHAGPYPGTISPQGTYVISGVPAGKWKVVVETQSLKNVGKTTLAPGVKSAVDADSMNNNPNMPKYVEVPPRYGNPQQSPLEVTVTGSRQTQDLELTD